MDGIKISHRWNFGDNRKIATELKELVLEGKKKATTSLLYEGKIIPRKGDYEAIVDSEGESFCVIRVTNVEVKPFLQVEYDFVQKEGEGDKNLEEWREKHRGFFNLKNDNVMVVCEEFEVIQRMQK